MSDRLWQLFDRIYRTDLVYEKDCWKRCGDAHCCHFSRYLNPAGSPGQSVQTLPLLFGERRYLQAHDLLRRFPGHEFSSTTTSLGDGQYTLEFIKLTTCPQGCGDHDHRFTVCRLYPLLPIFSEAGAVMGFDEQFTMFEVVEEMVRAPRACGITAVAFGELNKLLVICRAIASDPRCLFSMEMHRLMKNQFRVLMERTMEKKKVGAYEALGAMTGEGRFFDEDLLKEEINRLLDRFRTAHGPSFSPG